MRGLRQVLLAACLLAVAELASADCPAGGFAYAPAWVGAFKTYGIATDFQDPIEQVRAVAGKTGRICKECEGKLRGIQLVSKRAFGGGFLQFPVPVGESFCVSARVDVSRMNTTGAFAGLEFDSPAVPIDVLPATYLFVGIEDEDGIKSVWVDESGESVGTPLTLPADTRTAVVEIEYGGGSVSVRARAEQDAALTDVLTGHAFAWGGSGGLGAAAFDLAAGDRVGVALEAHGDVHGPALQAVLEEIQALLELQDAALADLAAAAPADARAKLEEARARIDPALLGAVTALPAAKAVAKAVKELQKAAQTLAAARDGLDAATPEGAAAAPALVEKARTAERRASRMLETGSPAEAKSVAAPTS
jgi:hypothetical protein